MSDTIKAISRAVAHNHIEEVKILLECGVDPNTSDWKRFTLLHLAALCSNIPMMRILLDAGADPNRTDRHGKSPLFYVVNENSPEAVEFIISMGADPNQGANLGSLPIHFTIDNTEIVEILLKSGTDVNRLGGENGFTPLYCFVTGNYCRRSIIKLLTYGADPNIATIKDKTPIYEAALRNNLDIVKVLLCAGADPQIAINGKTSIEQLNNEWIRSDISGLLEAWPKVPSLQLLCLRATHYNVERPDVPEWFPPLLLDFDNTPEFN